MLKIVQLGLTFYNKKNGELVGFSWQINFKEFDSSVDLYRAKAIEFVSKSGIDIDNNRVFMVDDTLFFKLF